MNTLNPGMCLLGVLIDCANSSAGAPAAAVAPDAGQPSSWTNITPPTGAPNPTTRELPAMAYYPSGHEVILFGGAAGLTYYNDTWAFANHTWKELIAPSSCTPKTCPSARAGAMLAYYPAGNALILFGGDLVIPGILVPYTIAYNDTWEFANGSWTNISSMVGYAPSPRFSGAMTYDPSDNYILLFGGENGSHDSLADTWKFSDGSWTNLTAGLTLAPASRAGAAIAYSPDGHVMLFGGADIFDNGVDDEIYENGCNPGAAQVAWWFYKGAWSLESGYPNSCIASPAAGTSATVTPAASDPVPNPPCGRVGAALGWSPKNNRFVLYGGYGAPFIGGVCSGTITYLNDTWTYDLPSGGGFLWNNATYPPGPPARAYVGSASDYSDDYFEIFGGVSSSGQLLNATWRFYEIVYAKLTGPLEWDTAPGSLQFPVPFTVLGYGGTGDLSYSFTIANTRNSNNLRSNECAWFYNSTSTALPFNGTVNIHCSPVPANFGIYHLVLTVTDEGNSSKPHASANWTFTVTPPEKMLIYSEYAQYFYTGVDFQNTFTLYAEVADGPATSITATIGGQSLTFVQSTNPKWWNATDVQMSSFSPGTTISATAQFDSNWTDNATFYVNMIGTPSWLGTLFKATGATQSISSHGAGPFNKTYTITESYNWALSNSANFSLPLPLVGGNYGLVPTINVSFNATSTGNLSLVGTLSLTPPQVSIGPISLKVTVSFSMSGTFDVVGSSVQWGSAQAQVSVSASLSASVPIYGFSLLGCNVGFTLQLTINPSITLDMILAPLTGPGTEIIPNVAITIQQFLGSFTLALSAAINFGIGIASIGLGVGLSVAVAFQLNPFEISHGWVNGSIFVTAQFLWWSDSFNIIGPATVFQWDPPGPGARPEAFVSPGYNNGTSSKWTVQVEYYKASDYDEDLWNAASSSGPAISDIYPWTSVSGAAAYNGADLFYSDANLSEPVTYGLIISGDHLDSSSNRFTKVPGPYDPNDYEVASPQATTLPDGDLYVLWDALPSSEADVTSPLNLTSMELQGAVFYPSSNSWGPIHTFSSTGFAQSYQVDALNGSSRVLELVASVPFLTNKASERLVEYDLGSGNVLANLSTSNLSEIVGFRAAAGLAIVESLGGNFSLLSLPSGAAVTIAYTPPTGYDLISAAFAGDSPSTLVLLYRGPSSSELVLYDTADRATLAQLALGGDALQGEGITNGATTFVFTRSTAGIEGWSEAGGTFTNYTMIILPNVVSYGLVQAGRSVVVYAIAPTGGNSTEPIRELELTELGAALPAVVTPSGVAVSPSAGVSSYLLDLAIVAGAVAVVLAVVAIFGRRRPPTPSSTPSPPPESGPSPPSGTTASPTSPSAPAPPPASPPT